MGTEKGAYCLLQEASGKPGPPSAWLGRQPRPGQGTALNHGTEAGPPMLRASSARHARIMGRVWQGIWHGTPWISCLPTHLWVPRVQAKLLRLELKPARSAVHPFHHGCQRLCLAGSRARALLSEALYNGGHSLSHPAVRGRFTVGRAGVAGPTLLLVLAAGLGSTHRRPLFPPGLPVPPPLAPPLSSPCWLLFHTGRCFLHPIHHCRCSRRHTQGRKRAAARDGPAQDMQTQKGPARLRDWILGRQ